MAHMTKGRVQNSRLKAEEYSKRQQNKPARASKGQRDERVLGITYSSCDSDEIMYEELQKYNRDLKMSERERMVQGVKSENQNRLQGLTHDQSKLQKKLNSMKRNMQVQKQRFDVIHDKIKAHSQLETSRQQLKDGQFINLRKEMQKIKGEGLNKLVQNQVAFDAGSASLSNFMQPNNNQQAVSQRNLNNKDAKKCHTHFTTTENAQTLLYDGAQGFVPAGDICKMCQQPFTLDQKTALISAVQEKQKDDHYSYNQKKKNLYVNNTSQGQAMQEWVQRGEVHIDASQVKVRGQDISTITHLKHPAVAPEICETSTTRFIRKLMVEENMHLVKMSSKSGNGFVNGGITLQKLQNRVLTNQMGGAQSQSHSNIDLLSLQIQQRTKQDKNNNRSPRGCQTNTNLNRSQDSQDKSTIMQGTSPLSKVNRTQASPQSQMKSKFNNNNNNNNNNQTITRQTNDTSIKTVNDTKTPIVFDGSSLSKDKQMMKKSNSTNMMLGNNIPKRVSSIKHLIRQRQNMKFKPQPENGVIRIKSFLDSSSNTGRNSDVQPQNLLSSAKTHREQVNNNYQMMVQSQSVSNIKPYNMRSRNSTATNQNQSNNLLMKSQSHHQDAQQQTLPLQLQNQPQQHSTQLQCEGIGGTLSGAWEFQPSKSIANKQQTVLASESNMMAVHNNNQRRSVSKLKIKLQSKLLNQSNSKNNNDNSPFKILNSESRRMSQNSQMAVYNAHNQSYDETSHNQGNSQITATESLVFVGRNSLQSAGRRAQIPLSKQDQLENRLLQQQMQQFGRVQSSGHIKGKQIISSHPVEVGLQDPVIIASSFNGQQSKLSQNDAKSSNYREKDNSKLLQLQKMSSNGGLEDSSDQSQLVEPPKMILDNSMVVAAAPSQTKQQSKRAHKSKVKSQIVLEENKNTENGSNQQQQNILMLRELSLPQITSHKNINGGNVAGGRGNVPTKNRSSYLNAKNKKGIKKQLQQEQHPGMIMVGQVPTAQAICVSNESQGKSGGGQGRNTIELDATTSPSLRKSDSKPIRTLHLNKSDITEHDVQDFILTQEKVNSPMQIKSFKGNASRFKHQSVQNKQLQDENTKNSSQDLAALMHGNYDEYPKSQRQEIFVVGEDTQTISVPADLGEDQQKQIVQNFLDSKKQKQQYKAAVAAQIKIQQFSKNNFPQSVPSMDQQNSQEVNQNNVVTAAAQTKTSIDINKMKIQQENNYNLIDSTNATGIQKTRRKVGGSMSPLDVKQKREKQSAGRNIQRVGKSNSSTPHLASEKNKTNLGEQLYQSQNKNTVTNIQSSDMSVKPDCNNNMTPNYYDSNHVANNFTSAVDKADKYSLVDDINHSIDITVPSGNGYPSDEKTNLISKKIPILNKKNTKGRQQSNANQNMAGGERMVTLGSGQRNIGSAGGKQWKATARKAVNQIYSSKEANAAILQPPQVVVKLPISKSILLRPISPGIIGSPTQENKQSLITKRKASSNSNSQPQFVINPRRSSTAKNFEQQ